MNAMVETPYVFIKHEDSDNTCEINNHIARLRTLLGDVTEKSLVSSFKKANLKIWDSILSNRFIPIYLLEDFYVSVLIAMIEDRESYISLFFNDWKREELVLEEICHSELLPWGSMIPRSTDFFWLVTDRRIESIRFSKSCIYNANGSIIAQNTTDDIIDLLKKRKIIPSIFVIIMIESFLGQIRLAGGLHQFAYYDTFKRAFLKSINTENDEEMRLYDLVMSQNLNHWGSNVLEPNIDVSEIIKYEGNTYNTLINQFMDYSFDDAVDDMIEFRSYHRWGELLCTSAKAVI